MIRVRAMTAEEQTMIERLAHSRTAEARRVERAESSGMPTRHQCPRIADHLGLHEQTIRLWLKRFNAQGLEGFADRRRGGRPATYTRAGRGGGRRQSDRSAGAGPPFASWTLDRLAAYLNEEQGIAIKRSRIGEILQRRGLALAQTGDLVRGAARSRLRRKKGAIVTLYTAPPGTAS